MNYADRAFRSSQILNSSSAKETGEFDRVWEYGPEDIEPEYWKTHKTIFKHKKGGGFWLWKPYIVLKAYQRMSGDDVLMYCDSGAEFIGSFLPLLEEFSRSSSDLLCFDAGRAIERDYSQKWIADAVGVSHKHLNSCQRAGGYFIIKRTKRVGSLLSDWLKYCERPELLINRDAGLAHRHDQTIFSLLTKGYDYEAHRDPSQFGLDYANLYNNSNYGQLLNLHRKRDLSLWQKLKKNVKANILP